MSRYACLLWIGFALLPDAVAQSLHFSGYFIETPLIWNTPPAAGTTSDRRLENLLHTRQNLRAYPHPNLTAALELKTRLWWGESADELRRSGDLYGERRTYFDWHKDVIEKVRIVLTSEVDRLWLNWTFGSLDLTAGRQRIAWGTNLVWNVVDLFNPRSSLDFDNVEMPGTDALRLQVHTSPVSSAELAFAPQKDFDQTVAAAQYSFNLARYDLHFLGGRERRAAVMGFAWSGQIWGGGFRGESLWRKPVEGVAPSTDQFSAAVSADYTFRNSLYFHSEILYNSLGTTDKAGGFALQPSLVNGWLTPSRWSIYGETAKDLHPLVRADLSGILNPYDSSWYLSPTLIWSAATNLDCTFSALIFNGDAGTEFGDYGDLYMIRIRWSY